MDADKIYRARVILPAAGADAAAFVAAKRGRIVAVGDDAEGRQLGGAGVPVEDFGDAAILPGLWDAHVHLLLTGLALRELNLGAARNLADVAALIREAAAGGEGVLVCGGLDETRLAEGRLPTGGELDAVAPARPVAVIRADSHSLILNAAATRALAVDYSWSGVEFDAAGAPTGRLRGRANELARAKIFAAVRGPAKVTAFREAAALAASRGIVALCALEGGPLSGVDDLRALASCRDELAVETFIFPQVTAPSVARELGLPRLGGCILVDGSFGSWTAALAEPYADRPASRGELYFDADTLNSFVMAAHAAGLQVALHAIGDRAITQVLDAFEAAQREFPREDCRHRLEHGELISNQDLARAAALGVVLSGQPAFESYWGGPGRLYELRLGERRRLTNRFRSALEAGVPVAGGSDANITPPAPLAGIAAAMAHPTPAERLTFDEALRAFTADAAASAFAERDWGTLDVGKWASFTVAARDPRGLKAEGLADLRVVATVVKGKKVYDAAQPGPAAPASP